MPVTAEPTASTKREEILEAAEAMIRTRGYNAFSTRDVADAVGIKAASVHYYFPTKADIGSAVTERYTARFIDELGDSGRFAGKPKEAVARYVDAFRRALVHDRKLCLCAVLGAEVGGLPENVSGHTRIFFERNLNWLTAAIRGKGMSKEKALGMATLVLASLEGAMILSKSLNDDEVFERVAEGLSRAIPVAELD